MRKITKHSVHSYAFCTDTLYNEALIEKIKGIDLLYHEATFKRIWQIEQNKLDIQQLMKLLQLLKNHQLKTC